MNTITTRPFETGDLGRLIAWRGLESPDFLTEGANHAAAARAFLAVAAQQGYEGVCLPNTVQGPVAALYKGELVYVDPDFRNDTRLAQFRRPATLAA